MSNNPIQIAENGREVKMNAHLSKANTLAIEMLGIKPCLPSDATPSKSLCGGIFRHISDAIFGNHFANFLLYNSYLEENNKCKSDFCNTYASSLPPEKSDKINALLESYSQVLESKRQNSLINCALAIAAFAGGILIAIGTLFSIIALIVTGGIIALGACGGAVTRFFCHRYARDSEIDTAKEIHHLWNLLQQGKL
jgi:hypothetical protein